MAFAFDNVTKDAGSYASVSSLSWSHTCASSAFLIVAFWVGNSISSISVTYNSVAMTLIGSVTGGDSAILYVYGMTNPASGANTVSISWTTARVSAGWAYSGTGSNSGFGTFASNTGTAITITDPTTAVASDWVVEFSLGRHQTTPAPTITLNAGQSSRMNEGRNNGASVYNKMAICDLLGLTTPSNGCNPVTNWEDACVIVKAGSGNTGGLLAFFN